MRTRAGRSAAVLIVASMAWLASAAAAAETAAAAATANDAGKQDVTFHRDVLPILQSHCQECHRPGGPDISGMIAPMSLVTYVDVRPWAKSIRQVVAAREMPPWGATHETSRGIVNSRSLEPDQIDTIVRWVDRGAPAGDPADAPPPRVFDDARWLIGEPDLILEMPEPIVVGDDVEDWQPYVSFSPHMHYRGKDMKYTAIYPDGTRELLIDVARYDFEWQIGYILEQPKLLPPGTQIEVEAHMDNSVERARKFAKIDAEKPVRWGLFTTDEMMHGFVTWSPISEVEARRWAAARGNTPGAGK